MPHVRGKDGKSYWLNPKKPLRKGDVLLSGTLEKPDPVKEPKKEEKKEEKADMGIVPEVPEDTKADKKESK